MLRTGMRAHELLGGIDAVEAHVERGPGRTATLPLGALRASLGYMSRRQDVDALTQFLQRTYADRVDDHNPAPERAYGPGWC